MEIKYICEKSSCHSLASIHVKARVEKRTISEAFVGVFLDDFFEVEFRTRFAAASELLAIVSRTVSTKLHHLK